MPDDFKLQVQGELLVTERKWCDFISYCGGLPMVTMRVEPTGPSERDRRRRRQVRGRINEVVATMHGIAGRAIPNSFRPNEQLKRRW
jgi:hypothetical protein